MDFNGNEIKNLIQGDDHQPLPPELDWSNMKDGIFDKMQSIEQEQSARSDRQRSWRRIGLLLSLFFVLTVGLYSAFDLMISDQNSGAYDTAQVPGTDEHESESSNITKSAPTTQPEDCGEVPVNENGKNTAEDLPLTYVESGSGSNQDPQKAEKASMDTDQSLAFQQQNENDPLNNLFDLDLIGATHSELDSAQNASSPLAETRLSDGLLYIPELQAFLPYSFDQVRLETRNHSMLSIQKTDGGFSPDMQPSKMSDQLILEGGITFWDKGYGNSKPEGAQYEAPIPSFQLQGSYVKGLKGSYFVMAGLQYQQLESKLDYRNTIEDYKITFIDTILQVQNNMLTGEQTIIRGDVEELVKAERRVIHYNKTQLFKASLALGKRWRFNSFQTDVYLGAALNSLVRNQGRMFSENTIIDYEGASNSVFQNQWTADGVFGVRLHYFLTQNIGVTTGFQTQKSLMNWSNQEGINFYPASFGLQLGLSYSLK